MSLMLRRAPEANWLSEEWQEKMAKIEDCLHCGQCMKKCPYGLNTPELSAKNYEDYKTFCKLIVTQREMAQWCRSLCVLFYR